MTIGHFSIGYHVATWKGVKSYSWLLSRKWKFLLRAVPRAANAGRYIERPTSPVYLQFPHQLDIHIYITV